MKQERMHAFSILPSRPAAHLRVPSAVWTCRILLASVFIWAAWHKIADPKSFALAVYQYQLLPDGFVNPIAITLPWVEVILAVALLARPGYRTPAALALLVLLTGFTAAILINLVRGLDISCGCFSGSAGSDPLHWGLVLRNATFMVLTAVSMKEPPLPQK